MKRQLTYWNAYTISGSRVSATKRKALFAELVLVVISETHSENCFLAVFVFFCTGAVDGFIIKLDHIYKKAWHLVPFELFKFLICENCLK